MSHFSHRLPRASGLASGTSRSATTDDSAELALNCAAPSVHRKRRQRATVEWIFIERGRSSDNPPLSLRSQHAASIVADTASANCQQPPLAPVFQLLQSFSSVPARAQVHSGLAWQVISSMTYLYRRSPQSLAICTRVLQSRTHRLVIFLSNTKHELRHGYFSPFRHLNASLDGSDDTIPAVYPSLVHLGVRSVPLLAHARRDGDYDLASSSDTGDRPSGALSTKISSCYLYELLGSVSSLLRILLMPSLLLINPTGSFQPQRRRRNVISRRKSRTYCPPLLRYPFTDVRSLRQALLAFEYIATFDQEVQLIWMRKKTPASLLFLVVRYHALISQVFLNAASYSVICSKYVKAQIGMEYAQFFTWAAFSGLRTLALSQMNWYLAAFVFVLASGPFVINMWSLSYGVIGANLPIVGCLGGVDVPTHAAHIGDPQSEAIRPVCTEDKPQELYCHGHARSSPTFSWSSSPGAMPLKDSDGSSAACRLCH
ncbi:hypothetical protein NUW54_g1672 [Trametes sanguinea]|uniref:Uncharacterized protein n=1 Tax=Trametes sanguinea TaxID=158606 RepID=A0ACC1Q9H5_9APHY|nr:hypothetical protein NUW54_g1672 [Trametes sanguinea]